MIHILVVSLNPGNLAFYTKLLMREQFEVTAVLTAEQGLEYLITHPAPCVVLVDVTMPADPLIDFLTTIAFTPLLRRNTIVYAGIGAMTLHLRSEAVHLMETIGMSLIDLNEGRFPLSREVTRLALRLQFPS
ncbi:MAG: response regulator [Ktedonobacterales bacterium]|nr:response regulator [Ktedonobacterales bacterium]